MRKIKSLADVQRILDYKCDVRDTQGHNIPFVRFVSMKLVDIVNIFTEEWTYSID